MNNISNNVIDQQRACFPLFVFRGSLKYKKLRHLVDLDASITVLLKADSQSKDTTILRTLIISRTRRELTNRRHADADILCTSQTFCFRQQETQMGSALNVRV